MQRWWRFRRSSRGPAAVAGVVSGALLANVIEIVFLSADAPNGGPRTSALTIAPLAGPNRAGLSLGVRF